MNSSMVEYEIYVDKSIPHEEEEEEEEDDVEYDDEEGSSCSLEYTENENSMTECELYEKKRHIVTSSDHIVTSSPEKGLVTSDSTSSLPSQGEKRKAPPK